jgi:phosphoribosylanthranilate isomerase
MANASFMAPGYIIKVCGITSATDAADAINAGANALGFNFYPSSPRYVTPQVAQEIAQSITVPYLRVGVFVNPTEEELIEAASTVPLDVLQLHGDKLPLHLAGSFRVWQAIQATAPPPLHPDVEAYLLDSPTPLYGGSGEAFDWTLAAAFPRRVLVAGGLDSSNVARAIRIARPWGVDACSRIEAQPGRKDPERVLAFVHAALAQFEAMQLEQPGLDGAQAATQETTK